jgi:hypothetical protein
MTKVTKGQNIFIAFFVRFGYLFHTEDFFMKRIRLYRNNTSGSRGVCLVKYGKAEYESHYWRARIYTRGKLVHIGLYETKELATAAYEKCKALEREGVDLQKYLQENIV